MQITAAELAAINGVVATVARITEHTLSNATKAEIRERRDGDLWFEVYDFGGERFVKAMDIGDAVLTIRVCERPAVVAPDQPIGPIDPNDPNGGGAGGFEERYAIAA